MRYLRFLAVTIACGTAFGASAAEPDGGLFFPGTAGNYVQLTTSTAIQNLTANFTLEAWCYPTIANNAARRVLSNWDNNPSRGWGFGQSNKNGWRLTTFGIKDFDTTINVVALNQWTHLAVTYEELTNNTTATAKFYLNGQFAFETTATKQCLQSTTALCIASRPAGGGEYWAGGIDEVRVWNYVRTPTEIQTALYNQLTGTEPGLLLCYSFEEDKGTATADKTGQTAGTIIGVFSWGPYNAAKEWQLYP